MCKRHVQVAARLVMQPIAAHVEHDVSAHAITEQCQRENELWDEVLWAWWRFRFGAQHVAPFTVDLTWDEIYSLIASLPATSAWRCGTLA